MYCVYRIKMEEYVPGHGWKDDGAIYSLDKIALEAEANRRKNYSFHDCERVKVGSTEIVKVHETFLRDLKMTPVLSTLKGNHPADEGTLAEHKETFQYMSTLKRLGRNSTTRAAG